MELVFTILPNVNTPCCSCASFMGLQDACHIMLHKSVSVAEKVLYVIFASRSISDGSGLRQIYCVC